MAQSKGWWQTLLAWLTKKPTPPPPPPPPPPPAPQGKLSLWSVGINSYASSPLQGCVNDSLNLSAYLSAKGAEIHQLHDRDATGPVMESFWRRAVQETGPDDTLVIHYSGHGSNGPSGLPDDPGQCLVSADMKPFYATRLGQILAEGHPDTTIVVVLDCCHSETATRLLGSVDYKVPKSVPWAELVDPGPVPSFKQHRAFNLTALARSPENGIVELAACQANDVTYDAHIGNLIQGCATRAWIDAATELDHDYPMGYTLREYQQKVRFLLPNAEFPNQPQLQASDWQREQVMWRPNR
jgi:caspase domain-containing protein